MTLLKKIENILKTQHLPQLIILCFIFVCLSQLIWTYGLTNIPNTGDEYAIWFQAKIFSHFQLVADGPSEYSAPLLTGHYVFNNNGKWFSAYPPVYSFLLSIGDLLGSIRFAIIFISVSNLIVLYKILTLIKMPLFTILSTLVFFAFSPSYLFYSSSYYNHLGELLLYLVVLFLHLKNCICGLSLKRVFFICLLATAGLGIRPLTTLVVFTPIFIHFILSFRKEINLRTIGVVFASSSFISILLLAYNYTLTGNAFAFPYYYAGMNNDKLSITIQLQDFLRILNMINETSLWVLPINLIGDLKNSSVEAFFNISLYLAIFCLIAYFFKITKKPSEEIKTFFYLVVPTLLLMVFAHLFYKWSGGRFGERFFFEVSWIPLVFIFYILNHFYHHSKKIQIILCSTLLILFLKILTFETFSTAQTIKKQNEVTFHLHKKIQSHAYDNSLIVLKGRPTPIDDEQFLIRNSPFFENATIAISPTAFIPQLNPEKEMEILKIVKKQLKKDHLYFYLNNDNDLILKDAL